MAMGARKVFRAHARSFGSDSAGRMGDGAAVRGAFLKPDWLPAQRRAQYHGHRRHSPGNVYPLFPSSQQRGIDRQPQGLAVPGRPAPGAGPSKEGQAGPARRRGMEQGRGGECVSAACGLGRPIAPVAELALALVERNGKGMSAATGRGTDIPRGCGSTGRFDFDRRELRGSSGQEAPTSGCYTQ